MRLRFLAVLLAGVAATFQPAAAEPGSNAPVTAAAPAAPAAAAAPSATGTDTPQVKILNHAPDAPASGAAPAAPGAPASPASPGTPSAAEGAGTPAKADTAAGTTAPAKPGDATSAGANAVPSSPASVPPSQATAAEPPAPPPEPTLVIDIDLTKQRMVVSENGRSKYRWPVSSARYGYRTPTGTFQPVWMSKMWYSRQYDYAPMPHAIFFHQGVAIHGSYAIGALGRPASHGCVRLAPRNASLLYRLVNQHGKAATRIVVHGTPDHSSARVAAEDRYDRDGAMPIRRGSMYYYEYPPTRRYAGYGGYGYGYYGGYGYAPPRDRRYVPSRRYAPRGLYSGYTYGYGF